MPFLALIPLRVWLIGGAAIAIIIGGLAYRQHLINQGEERIRQQIEEQNRADDKKADNGQAGPDACFADGREWDRANRLCLPKRP